MLVADEVRCVQKAGALLGEGPVWVASEQALFWLDIHGKLIHRYDPCSTQYASWPTPFRICSIAPRRDGGFVGGSERGFVLIDRELKDFDLIGNPENEMPSNRFNDGKLDPAGRFWAGTMDDREIERTGALYRLDADLRWSCHDSGYGVTNGPTFSPDGRVLYHTDSAALTIYRFDLTPSGEIGGKTVFAHFKAEQGHPDGMTTDAEGCLWVAFWDGWCIRRLSPDGEIIAEIAMPVQRPTSCAFAGERLERLFVTSATVGLTPSARENQPLAGGLFELQPGIAGLPLTPFPA